MPFQGIFGFNTKLDLYHLFISICGSITTENKNIENKLDFIFGEKNNVYIMALTMGMNCTFTALC